jgi:hypothetical protein
MLRHYPNESEMIQDSRGAPAIFQEKMEPLYRMVKQFDMEKKDES